MKLNKLIVPSMLFSVALLCSCGDDDDNLGSTETFFGTPYEYMEDVEYKVMEEVQINDSTTTQQEVTKIRQRKGIACKFGPAGDYGVAFGYGFCYSSTGTPTVYDKVFKLDMTWGPAVVGLQEGILRDTLLVTKVPAGTIVRGYLIPYPSGDIRYSEPYTIQ